MRLTHTRSRRWLAAFFILGLLAASCGSDDEAVTANANVAEESVDAEPVEPETTTTAAPTTTVAPTTTQAEEPEPQVSELEPPSIDFVEAGPASFTAAGGISLETPQDVTAIQSNNCVVLVEADYEGDSPFEPGIAIGTAAFLGRDVLTPITSLEDWFDGYEAEGQDRPVATGDTISLLGEELDGYRIDGAFPNEEPGGDAVLSCAVDGDVPAGVTLFAGVFSDLFVAETDDGLLVAIANGFTEEENVRAKALFDAVIPTVERDESVDTSGPEILDNVEALSQDLLQAGTHEVDALGGIEFTLPDSTRIFTSGDCLIIESPNYVGSSPFGPTFAISRVVSSGTLENGTQPLATIEDWIALYGDEPAPQPNGKSITVLGQELSGFDVAGAFPGGPPPPDSVLNCASSSETVSELWFLQAPLGEVFAAETDDGVMFADAGAFTEDELVTAREFFDEMIPSVVSAR